MRGGRRAGVFAYLAGSPVGGDGSQIAIDVIVFDALADLLATAVGITVLSKFYRHIVGMDAPEGGEGGAAENSA